ncbi:MAG: ABC transporter ATP-binding protein [Thermoplasmataceae archaeon]
MAFVEIKNISKRYSDFSLRNISLELEKGKILTLMGESGSGKTSILRIISGLDFPDSGKVLISGRDITEIRPGKRNVGMVFQDLALFPHMTAYDNIAYGLRSLRYKESRIEQMVSNISETLRISSFLEKFPGNISGGEKQRVAMARSLVMEPDLLLMDEPMSSLDPGLRNDIMVEIKSISRKLDQTMIYVTHDVKEGLFLGDSIVYIGDGEVVRKGSPEEIWNNPESEKLARFLGFNIIKVNGKKVAVGPEEIEIVGNSEITGKILGYGFEGSGYRLDIELADGQKIRVLSERINRSIIARTNNTVAIQFEVKRVLA